MSPDEEYVETVRHHLVALVEDRPYGSTDDLTEAAAQIAALPRPDHAAQHAIVAAARVYCGAVMTVDAVQRANGRRGASAAAAASINRARARAAATHADLLAAVQVPPDDHPLPRPEAAPGLHPFFARVLDERQHQRREWADWAVILGQHHGEVCEALAGVIWNGENADAAGRHGLLGELTQLAALCLALAERITGPEETS